MIVEDEQRVKNRAEYGKKTLQELSKRLTKKFDKGFSSDNLERMKKLYILYSNSISASPLRKLNLSWSHYPKLMRMETHH